MKRGQGNIVTVVLLILIIVAAIVIITAVIIPLVKESGKETETGVGSISTDLEIKNVEIFWTGEVNITIHRGSDKNNINGLNFVFYESDGNNKVVKIREKDIINTTRTRIFNFNHSTILNENRIEKVSIIPIIDDRLGIEILESESNILTDRDGKRIYKNPDGLLVWWKFDGNARDSVHSYHGEFLGDALIISDSERGQVANFDGDGDYMDLNGGLEDINFYGGESGASTISAWINVNESDNYNYIFNDVAGTRYFITDPSSSGRILMTRVRYTDDSSSAFYSDGFIPDNDWAFVALIVDCSKQNVNFYIGGNLDVSHTPSKTCKLFDFDTVNKPAIAKGYDAISYFNGTMDDVMIFSRALSDSEIKGLYINQRK